MTSYRYEFGKLCAHFAGAIVAIVALVGVVLLKPMVLVWVFGAIAVGNAIIGISVYLELRRKENVKGKGIGEVK